MNDHTKLAAEVESIRKASRVITICVWGVAVGVMVYGLGNVYGLLVTHDVPTSVAWILSPMVDAGLCVGLVGTAALARHGMPAGWVGALRWVTALMTWSLNIASPLTGGGGPDWLGVFIHSVGPILLFVVVEAAASFQHKIGNLIAEKEAKLSASDAKWRQGQAERTEMADRIRRLTADLTAAERRDAQYAEEIASVRRELSVAQADADALKAASERIVSDHAEEIAKVRAEARETVATAKAEARTLRLDDYRSGGGSRKSSGAKRRGAAEPAPKVALTHEEAVQKCLAEHPEQNWEWTQSEIVRITGCGWGRAPKLLAALTEDRTSVSSGESDGGCSEDASAGEEDSRVSASA